MWTVNSLQGQQRAGVVNSTDFTNAILKCIDASCFLKFVNIVFPHCFYAWEWKIEI